MTSGRLAALGINAASNTTARQKKAAARRKEDPSRILLKSYAEGPSAQTIPRSVFSSVEMPLYRSLGLTHKTDTSCELLRLSV